MKKSKLYLEIGSCYFWKAILHAQFNVNFSLSKFFGVIAKTANHVNLKLYESNMLTIMEYKLNDKVLIEKKDLLYGKNVIDITSMIKEKRKSK